MKRSHRLLREAHARRMDRMERARVPGAYDAAGGSAAMQAAVLALHGEGLLSVGDLHTGMTAVYGEVSDAMSAELGGDGLSGWLGLTLAAAAFARRARGRDGRLPLDGRDVRTARACAALGEALVMERVLRALDEVMRRRALVDHRAAPAWPSGYLERRAREAAEVMAEARAGATGIGGTSGAYAEGHAGDVGIGN